MAVLSWMTGIKPMGFYKSWGEKGPSTVQTLGEVGYEATLRYAMTE